MTADRNSSTAEAEMVLVPREPTENMLYEADRAIALPESYIRQVYAAMLRSAPALTAAPKDTETPGLREAAAMFFVALDQGPEKDCWDTENGEPEEGANKFASDWSWQDYHERVQKARDNLRAALSATSQPVAVPDDGDGWRTIDSAPKDGTTVLIGRYRDGWEEIITASWNMYPKVGEDGLHGFRGYMDGATHWMPLPTPPAIEPSPVEGDRR